MPRMSSFEQGFCRSAGWSALAARAVLPWALQGARVTGEVLEIGAGAGAAAGAAAAELLRRDPSVRVTVTDLDPEMVADARDRLAPFGDRATATVADATSLDAPAGSFDAVVSLLMLHHVGDWRGALAEAVRVLRPGGALLGYDLLDSPLWRAVHELDGSPYELVDAAVFGAAVRKLALEPVKLSCAPAGLAVRFWLVRLGEGGAKVAARVPPAGD